MNKKGNLFIGMGLLLIAAALFLILLNMMEDRQAEQTAMDAVSELEDLIPVPEETESEEEDQLRYDDVEIPDYILNPDMEMPVKRLRGLDYIGILRFPTLNHLKLPVVSHWDYNTLKAAPSRYSGSVYKNDMVIAAHNYVTHFGNLKKLQLGDTVTFTDIDGNMFIFEVVEMETLKPTDVDEMISGDWDLTLFTCTVGGATRVTIRLNRISRQLP